MSLIDFESGDTRWVAIADRIGLMVNSGYFHDLRALERCMGWLLQRALEQPARIGLVRAIMLAEQYEGAVVDSLPLMDPSEIAPAQRWVALSLLVRRGSMNEDSAQRLAALALEVDVDERGRSLYHVSSAAIRGHRFDEGNDQFFLHLERAVPREDVPSRHAILDYLTESFRRQRSSLGDKTIWRRLKLPEMPGH